MGLQRHSKRRQRAKSILNRLDIEYDVVNAIDGQKLDRENYNTRLVNMGEVGCHLTHQKIYMDALDAGYERICIFEDDIIPHSKADEMFIGLKRVPEVNIIYLGASDWYIDDNIRSYISSNPYYEADRINSTHAYIITKQMMQKAVKIFDKPIVQPCDTTLHQLHDEYKCYVMKPNLFIQNTEISSIRESRDLEDASDTFDWNLDAYECSWLYIPNWPRYRRYKAKYAAILWRNTIADGQLVLAGFSFCT